MSKIKTKNCLKLIKYISEKSEGQCCKYQVFCDIDDSNFCPSNREIMANCK